MHFYSNALSYALRYKQKFLLLCVCGMVSMFPFDVSSMMFMLHRGEIQFVFVLLNIARIQVLLASLARREYKGILVSEGIEVRLASADPRVLMAMWACRDLRDTSEQTGLGEMWEKWVVQASRAQWALLATRVSCK